MAVKSTMREIAERINKTIDKLSDSEIEAMITKIKVKGKNNKIFVMGVGRSGLVARMFTMRLVHLGLTAYVIGEIVTPAMTKNDLLITVSGSGGTKSVVSAAKTAGEIGTEVLSITSHPGKRTISQTRSKAGTYHSSIRKKNSFPWGHYLRIPR